MKEWQEELQKEFSFMRRVKLSVRYDKTANVWVALVVYALLEWED